MHRRTHSIFLAAWIASIVILAVATSPACVKAPPTLSPVGAAAFYKARVVKAVDIIRDTAIAAADAQPPLILRNDATNTVKVHQSILLTIQASSAGWKPAVKVALNGLLRDLSAGASRMVKPYVVLAQTLLEES